MKSFFTLALLSSLSISPLMAATPAETREQAFKKILISFEPMGVVVRGRDPYKKDSFARHAEALQLIAAEPFKHFPVNSITGKSRSKPNIWSQPAKFEQEKRLFLQSVTALTASARQGDLALIKRDYATVSQSCKSCHDSFRGPKK